MPLPGTLAALDEDAVEPYEHSVASGSQSAEALTMAGEKRSMTW
jgi:hypothetical protein